ncbi:tRNA 2-selenouridine(34) synthase MnmH [Bdellovibrio sp. HCB288]|uniref:tRNA 2-selenouridine(34) synthase MnmH n=1 Tax=Bdellovibrio sp. HCB288 TaxID=3394355 RepID=UPI0039B3AB3C
MPALSVRLPQLRKKGFRLSSIPSVALKQLFLQRTPLIDVRAPVEFSMGTLPGAINLPIMDDAQRAAVGTTYKQSGREAALILGHELVSGEVKQSRLQGWAEYIRANPKAVLFCFRGGLRSRITQQWLAEMGIHRPLIEGGYKVARQFLREVVDQHSQVNGPFIILSGPTGSAKTTILHDLKAIRPMVDLEALARHRGSAFGASQSRQPTQIDFEHAIALDLLRLSSGPERTRILIEDESRLIGRCAIPESLFTQMRASAVVYLDEPFEQRVENIFNDYVVNTPIGQGAEDAALAEFAKFKNAVKIISRKLGGLRAQEILNDLEDCERDYLSHKKLDQNRAWIAKLLRYYYDPAYLQSFEKRNPEVLLRGRADVVVDYLKQLK